MREPGLPPAAGVLLVMDVHCMCSTVFNEWGKIYTCKESKEVKTNTKEQHRGFFATSIFHLFEHYLRQKVYLKETHTGT